MAANEKVTSADLRSAIARSGIPIYVIAGQMRLNPITLSRILRGHVPLSDEVAARVFKALHQLEETTAHAN